MSLSVSSQAKARAFAYFVNGAVETPTFVFAVAFVLAIVATTFASIPRNRKDTASQDAEKVSLA
jgi:hypothetical protein